MGRLAVWLACLIGLALTVPGQEPVANPPATPANAATPAAGAPMGLGPGPTTGMDPGTLFHMARQMDANGDLLVEEKELAEGFTKFTQDADVVRTDLLAWLDKDKDGKLSMDEWRPFFKAMWMWSSIRGVDKNGDMTLQASEIETARTQMDEFCRAANERTLRQFDADHDGKLNEAEIQAARRAMRRFSPRGPANGATRGGTEGGAAGQTAPEASPAPAGGAQATPPPAAHP